MGRHRDPPSAGGHPGQGGHHPRLCIQAEDEGGGRGVQEAGIEFIPLAVRSLGSWEEVGERQVKKLGDWPAGADRHPQIAPEADCPPIER